MRNQWTIGLIGLVIALSGCKKDDEAQSVVPDVRGQRGESCEARNDCEEGLACINRTCSRNDFPMEVKAEVCERVDCATDVDCCGTRPLNAPVKCDARAVTCSATLQGCSTTTTCTDATQCNGGTCEGRCTNTYAECTTDAQCIDTCNLATGYCTLTTYLTCTSDAQCTRAPGTCGNRRCDCTNPAYNPADPICTDPECADVCSYRCVEERCVVDSSCKTDTDCLYPAEYCVAGTCVECRTDPDCDEDDGEKCLEGVCKKPCKFDEECPLFHKCDTTAGKCVESGCTSDRECVLALSRTATTEDARLAKCLPSAEGSTRNECKIPCDNDGSCGEMQDCQDDFCVFIGCTTNEECRSYLGITDQVPTDTRPWVPKAVCRAPTP